jgi:hypothetical protein
VSSCAEECNGGLLKIDAVGLMNVKVKLIGCINCKEVEPKKIPSKKHCSTNSRENIEKSEKMKAKTERKKPKENYY